MRYVVTGAAGFIGSHLAEALLDAGHDVLAIDCFTDYYDVASKEDNALRLDVQRTDLAEHDLDFRGTDAVFHLAGQPGTRSFGNVFDIYLRRNLLATQRVFEAALAAQIPVVWSSSSSIYGDASVYPTSEDVPPRPATPYGVTKLGCEHLQETYRSGFGLHAVALRYFTVYGPRQRPDMAFARMIDSLIRSEEFEVYGDGLQTRSFTYVSDVVDATIRALDASPGVYNVGGGEELSLRDVVAILEEVAGRRLRVRYGKEQTGDMRRSNADVSCIERELGWRPTTDPQVGLTRQWESSTARAQVG
jgi:nucleoside-diphosphate-sugar epimerase